MSRPEQLPGYRRSPHGPGSVKWNRLVSDGTGEPVTGLRGRTAMRLRNAGDVATLRMGVNGKKVMASAGAACCTLQTSRVLHAPDGRQKPQPTDRLDGRNPGCATSRALRGIPRKHCGRTTGKNSRFRREGRVRQGLPHGRSMWIALRWRLMKSSRERRKGAVSGREGIHQGRRAGSPIGPHRANAHEGLIGDSHGYPRYRLLRCRIILHQTRQLLSSLLNDGHHVSQ